jgi:hypothetical protein
LALNYVPRPQFKPYHERRQPRGDEQERRSVASMTCS